MIHLYTVSSRLYYYRIYSNQSIPPNKRTLKLEVIGMLEMKLLSSP